MSGQSFDIIQVAGQGYSLVWSERPYIVRLALLPVPINLVCYSIIFMLDLTGNPIRQALILLPGFFAEGWMVSHLVRLIYLGQRWPFRPVGDPDKDIKNLNERAYGVTAGTVCYVLIKMIFAGLIAVFDFIYNTSLSIDDSAMRPEFAVLFLILCAGFFWAFRFFWIFIVFASGGTHQMFLEKVRNPILSFSFLGVWLLSFIPLMLLAGFFVSFFAMFFQGPDYPPEFEFFLVLVNVVFESVAALVSTAAIAYALQSLIRKNA